VTEVAENTLVDSRYLILRRIGSGGMADVYCAEDTHLGRQVALKVLHRRFAQDQEFVERFRREASAAAGLQHPNVVGVFDRGRHDGTYYIAMEHLPGRTLKEIVNTEAPLPQEQVVDLGIQILQAAGFAHRHGVIHRDFKPHNVIVDDRGAAKVTDFGIARAGASEMTETGSIMGTAQYLSPEQAQGHAVTAASDLYSIGVMLYEMLSGRLPFEGDSAVAVALKHLSEPPLPISQLRPDVNPALESVVMAALAKDPAHRWQSAEDFVEGLQAAGTQLEHGAPLPQDTAAFAPVPAAELPPPPPPVAPAGEGRERRWPWIAIGLLTVALAGFLIYLVAAGLTGGESKEVPRVVGKQLIEARQILERAGFEVDESRAPSEAPVGQVIDQDPNPHEKADDGSTVTLEVSEGPGTVRVPTVAGQPQAVAIDTLKKQKIDANVDQRSSSSVERGIAIRTIPAAGEVVNVGDRVQLYVSSGPAQVKVPDVTGLARDSAEQLLTDAGLEPAIVETESEKPENEVISQSPAADTEVDKGARVTITVSKGITTVAVPDVQGSSRRDAAAQLRAAGLVPTVREQDVTDPAQDGVVIDERPGAATQLAKGKQVVIVVGVLISGDQLQNPGDQGSSP
jgi:eukaryotic-like serine/threonine-protein kinase